MESGPWWALVTTWVVVNVVNLAQTVGFASRRRHGMAVLVPYLVLFFGSIVVMGASMYPANRSLWLVTVATSAALVASMTWALRQGTA
jgi:predicted ferric reductase